MADKELLTMSWIDYTVFISMLTLSTVTGLYHGIKRRKNNTVDEYLFGGRNIPAVPVILSNMASTVSSIGQVLLPVEAYYYGGQLMFIGVGEFLGYVMLYYFFLPVFYNLKFTSLFQYLEMRFNRTTRILASVIYTVTQIFYALIIMYSSCLAISRAIPVPFYALSSILCTLCTIYTVLGGLRGVVWTDFLQSLFMYTSLLTIIITTTYNVGGVSKVIDIAKRGGRLDVLNFDPNPFSRYSIWSILLSAAVFAIFKDCTSPGIIQRHLSLQSYSKSKAVALLSGTAIAISGLISTTVGIVLYATYYDCDPVLNQTLSNSDQIVPYHVMKLQSTLPGLTGIFMTGVTSAALSSLSTILNSLSGILFDDIVKPLIPIEWNDTQINFGIKTIVVVIGLIITIGIFGLNPSAGGYQLFRTLTSLTGSFTIFVFGYGLFYRRADKKSALIGAIAGVIVSSWIGIGSQNAIALGKIKYVTKVVSIEGCPGNISQILNITTSGSPEYKTPVIFADDVPYLYRITFSLLMFIGLLVSVCVGILVSLFTNNKNNNVDESLLIPQIRRKRKNETKDMEENVCLKSNENKIMTN